MRHPSIQTVSEGQLRAWADARVISAAVYVEEVERRRGTRVERLAAPPLDYELEVDGLKFDPAEFAVPVISIGNDADLNPFDFGPRLTDRALAAVGAITVAVVALVVWAIWPW